ncbi:MAG: HAD-IA family hydrolase [Proteobacteria bacterium]|nr:HAD-IA family hydrolase [Pseudomonadota bacterium]MDA1057377.1 HAD-IA family hydrolase [Pseudomonadota bacterium]
MTVVLFDLGNVLVEVAGYRVLAEWLGESNHDAVVEHWLASPAVQQFERGQCTPEVFAAAVTADYNLDLTVEGFIAAFSAWPQGLSPGAATLVEDARSQATTACFSNSNVIHWNTAKDHTRIRGLFAHAYSSHEIGHVKPDRAAFAYVIADLGVRPDEIVFLDDAASNVAAARAMGIRGYRTVGVGEARAVLSDLGLVSQA